MRVEKDIIGLAAYFRHQFRSPQKEIKYTRAVDDQLLSRSAAAAVARRDNRKKHRNQ